MRGYHSVLLEFTIKLQSRKAYLSGKSSASIDKQNANEYIKRDHKNHEACMIFKSYDWGTSWKMQTANRSR
jgi:hypothetical protein